MYSRGLSRLITVTADAPLQDVLHVTYDVHLDSCSFVYCNNINLRKSKKVMHLIPSLAARDRPGISLLAVSVPMLSCTCSFPLPPACLHI